MTLLRAARREDRARRERLRRFLTRIAFAIVIAGIGMISVCAVR